LGGLQPGSTPLGAPLISSVVLLLNFALLAVSLANELRRTLDQVTDDTVVIVVILVMGHERFVIERQQFWRDKRYTRTDSCATLLPNVHLFLIQVKVNTEQLFIVAYKSRKRRREGRSWYHARKSSESLVRKLEGHRTLRIHGRRWENNIQMDIVALNVKM
jgi:hypothetical protein